MIRRDLLLLIGGAALSRPVHARAQQAERVRRIGVMMVNAENDLEGQTRIGAFRRALEGHGWLVGRNLHLDYRWGTGEPERARRYAAELVSLEPDAILANGTPAVAALQRATRAIPVVFVVVTDPVGGGYVQSLARPGGNITGFSTFEPEIGGKWLGLLKEAAPRLRRVGGILDPGFRGFSAVWDTIERLAPRLGVEASTVIFREAADDIEGVIAEFGRQPAGGLIVFPTAINNLARERIVSSAASQSLPAIYPFRHYAVGGGLMSYGFEARDLFRRAATYADRILKGERPADLPVQAPTKFELVLNLRTARALGLAIPRTLLARADEVIE